MHNFIKFHHQWQPDEVAIEPNFPKETATQLQAMGYKIAPRTAIGRTEVIRILKGKLEFEINFLISNFCVMSVLC